MSRIREPLESWGTLQCCAEYVEIRVIYTKSRLSTDIWVSLIIGMIHIKELRGGPSTRQRGLGTSIQFTSTGNISSCYKRPPNLKPSSEFVVENLT